MNKREKGKFLLKSTKGKPRKGGTGKRRLGEKGLGVQKKIKRNLQTLSEGQPGVEFSRNRAKTKGKETLGRAKQKERNKTKKCSLQIGTLRRYR